MQPAARRNEVLAWVRGGLRDFSISRAAVEWGIRIPRDTSQTVYVWCVPSLTPNGQACGCITTPPHAYSSSHEMFGMTHCADHGMRCCWELQCSQRT